MLVATLVMVISAPGMAAPEESRTVPDTRAEFTCARDEGQHSRLPRRANAASNPVMNGRLLLNTYTSRRSDNATFRSRMLAPNAAFATAGNRTCTPALFSRLWFYGVAIIAARERTVRCRWLPTVGT